MICTMILKYFAKYFGITFTLNLQFILSTMHLVFYSTKKFCIQLLLRLKLYWLAWLDFILTL